MESMTVQSGWFAEDGHETSISLRLGFACEPVDLSRYIERGRWDLVFNALCLLAGATEEGCA